MKKTAKFTDEQLRLVSKALHIAYTSAMVFGSLDEADEIQRLQDKVFDQLHGTEATDVEGI